MLFLVYGALFVLDVYISSLRVAIVWGKCNDDSVLLTSLHKETYCQTKSIRVHVRWNILC